MKKVLHQSKEELFKSIYDLTFEKMNRIFSRALKCEELTNDVLQETYLKLWCKLEELDGKQDYMPFLYFHARNFARKEINARLKKDSLDAHPSILNEVSDVEGQMEKKEFQLMLSRAVNAMPPKRQMVYRMFKEDGLSYKHIAEMLNISNKTVDNHLNEAMKTIKKRLVLNYRVKDVMIWAMFHWSILNWLA